jgi:transcriptional regulator with XRE-family HTH domain
MNSVERVKAICKERKIPISKIEKDLGFANGYIGQLRKGVFPADRLKNIAEYLDVSTEYLLSGYDNESKNKYYISEETAEMAKTLFENRNLRVLFDAAKDASPEDLKTTYDMLMALKKKERGENEF